MKLKATLAVCAFTTAISVHAGEMTNEKAFQILDKNNDGFITQSEVSSVKNLVKDWKKIDKDANGNIDSKEFAALGTDKSYFPAESAK